MISNNEEMSPKYMSFKAKAFFQEMLGDITEPVLAFGINDVRLEGVETSEHRIQLADDLNARLRTQAT
ncbi:hypothetical protein, partial [Acinetobacter sp. A47]|uniref:hypothetical protein n=1 Tax=Acinetobacter sp. A47 TaxID=1561217 RepID=UPI001269FED4